MVGWKSNYKEVLKHVWIYIIWFGMFWFIRHWDREIGEQNAYCIVNAIYDKINMKPGCMIIPTSYYPISRLWQLNAKT